MWDGFIYAAFSINLITLGLLAFSYAPFIPDGSLVLGVILAGLYLVFQTITYAALIAVMPRAGGDYVWISRVLGGGIGFVLAVTGWWFILWHWVPIYADLLNKEVFVPIGAILGLDGFVNFFSGSTGLFTSSMIVALLASAYISLGMRAYARIQKICFYGGLVGLAAMILVLIVSSGKTSYRPLTARPSNSSAPAATPTSRPSRPVRRPAASRPARPSIRRCS